MSDKSEIVVADLLNSWTKGESKSLEQLLPLALKHLRKQARFLMRGERANHTWGPSGLLDEAICKFLRRPKEWASLDEFLKIGITTMRKLLQDYGRYKCAEKRNGPEVSLDGDGGLELPNFGTGNSPEKALGVYQALDKLKEGYPDVERDFTLYVIFGFTYAEIAGIADYSETNVRRNCVFGRAFLKKELG